LRIWLMPERLDNFEFLVLESFFTKTMEDFRHLLKTTAPKPNSKGVADWI